MLRLVDDFMFITSSRAGAEAIVALLRRGFPDYGCAINPAKTRTNFGMRLPSGEVLPPNVWRSRDGATFIRWCGLLVNATTLDLMADYSRYSGQHISSSLTLPLTLAPGRQLLTKIIQYVRPKCHALLLDTTTNSPTTVRLNIYQGFLLCAMKFHWYVRTMSGGGRGASADPRLCLRAIQAAIAYMVSMVRSRVRLAKVRLGLDCRCSVSRCHIRWLGLRAFHKVLARKQAGYGLLLAAVRRELGQRAYRHLAAQLADVVDDARSCVFDEIAY